MTLMTITLSQSSVATIAQRVELDRSRLSRVYVEEVTHIYPEADVRLARETTVDGAAPSAQDLAHLNEAMVNALARF